MAAKQEIFITGTPYQFSAIVAAFKSDHQGEWGGEIRLYTRSSVPRTQEGFTGQISDSSPRPGDNPISVEYYYAELPGVAIINAMGLGDRTRLTLKLDGRNDKKLLRIWEVLLQDLQKLNVLEAKEAKITLPMEPQTRDLTEWFDWYHQVKGKIRVRMQYIADQAGYALSTVYKEHTLYMAERGITSKKSKKK